MLRCFVVRVFALAAPRLHYFPLPLQTHLLSWILLDDDDDVYDYIRWRLIFNKQLSLSLSLSLYTVHELP